MAKVPLLRLEFMVPTGAQQNAREEDLLAPHRLFYQSPGINEAFSSPSM
jgi:hypothetical protein